MMRKNTFKAIFAYLILLVGFNMNAQIKTSSKITDVDGSVQLTPDNQQYFNEYGVVRCATLENEELLKQQFPNRLSTEQFEKNIAPIIAKIKADRAAGKAPQAVYNIPVVVHVMHNGEAVGTAPNITDAQVISQIDVFNEDFRRMAGTPGGANTTGVAVDVELNFCLAQQDPDDNPTSGINRINMGQDGINAASSGAALAAFNAFKPATQWDPTRYMNMWSVKFSGGASGLLGYAQFPDNTPNIAGINNIGGLADTDGVVAAYHTFGTIDKNDGSFLLNAPYNKGRTMTHEVGHWLGLRHIWGDGDCTADDFCADTPNSDALNGGCNTNDVSCGSVDMVQNYMDYTNDTCMDTFTQDQKDRMQAIMAASPRRMELNSSLRCEAPSTKIRYSTTSLSVNEATDCAYTDVTVTLKIGVAANQNADVTVTTSGTASANDYQVIGGNVTFAAGSDADKTFTVRIFNDGLVEADETIVLGMTLNANGGNAEITTELLQQQTITIVNDDSTLLATTQTDILTFAEDATGWTILNANGGTSWGTYPGGISVPGVIENNFLGSRADTPTTNDYMISPAVMIPASTSALSIQHALISANATQNYELYFTTGSTTNEAGIQNGILLSSGTATDYTGSNALETINLTPFLAGMTGQTGRFVLRHTANTQNNGYLFWDTITVTAGVQTTVQTAINAATKYTTVLNATGTTYASDSASGNAVAAVTNTNGVDYGCTDISVSRASGGAQMYQVAGTANYVMDKTITITPATVQAGGNVTLRFYFTEAELVAWENATGNVRADLMIIKDNGSTQEPVAATVSAFGSEFSITGTFTSGINGTYYFGKSSALSIADNDFALFNIYPNPSNGNVNITLSSNEDVQVSLYDIRGRQVYVKSFDNHAVTFTKTINFSAMATGVYLLNIESGSKRATKKLVIQ